MKSRSAGYKILATSSSLLVALLLLVGLSSCGRDNPTTPIAERPTLLPTATWGHETPAKDQATK